MGDDRSKNPRLFEHHSANHRSTGQRSSDHLASSHHTERRKSGRVSRSHRHSACSCRDALPLSRLPMSYLGVIDLENGNRYRTPDGVVISWEADTLTICEPTGIENSTSTAWNVWKVKDVPPVVIDKLGNHTVLPTNNAIFVLADGSKLLLGSDTKTATKGTRPIAQARYFYAGIPLSSQNITGYDAKQITIIANAGLSKELDE